MLHLNHFDNISNITTVGPPPTATTGPSLRLFKAPAGPPLTPTSRHHLDTRSSAKIQSCVKKTKNEKRSIKVEMVCLGPQSHGGDAGGDPPERPTKWIPSQCEGSGKRGVTKHQHLKKAFKNKGGPLELDFEWKDQETFKSLGPHGSYFISYIEELIRKLPHNYESWEKLPEADKALIIPSLESYFDLRPHLNYETIISVNGKKKTIRSMVHAGLKKDFYPNIHTVSRP